MAFEIAASFTNFTGYLLIERKISKNKRWQTRRMSGKWQGPYRVAKSLARNLGR